MAQIELIEDSPMLGNGNNDEENVTVLTENGTPILDSDTVKNGDFSPEIKTLDEKQEWIRSNRLNIGRNGCRIVSKSYKYLNVISEGVYGVVHRAKCIVTGDIVALKKIKVHKTRSGFPQSSLREINILSQLHHENIISVREVVIDKDYVDIFMVMDYAANDIQSIMHNNNKTNKTNQWYWPLNECKCLMYQLLEGIKYLHSMFILHRDLKTSNLLLSNNGIVKICDFGMARQFECSQFSASQYTNYVVTLWYRAPELLLAANTYNTPIDMWSTGCILAELLTGNVLFPGDGEFAQINLIFALLGTPTEEEWKEYPNLPHGPKKFSWRIMKRKINDKFPTKKIMEKNKNKNKIKIKDKNGNNNCAIQDINIEMNGKHQDNNNKLEDENDDIEMKENNNEALEEKKEEERIFTEQTVDLLQKLLIYDPNKRITATNALLHPFFTGELPKMCKKPEMPKFEEHHVKHTRKEKRPDDVGQLNKTNDNQEAASC